MSEYGRNRTYLAPRMASARRRTVGMLEDDAEVEASDAPITRTLTDVFPLARSPSREGGEKESNSDTLGTRYMTEGEVSSLVHNALRRARQATSSVSPRRRTLKNYRPITPREEKKFDPETDVQSPLSIASGLSLPTYGTSNEKSPHSSRIPSPSKTGSYTSQLLQSESKSSMYKSQIPSLESKVSSDVPNTENDVNADDFSISIASTDKDDDADNLDGMDDLLAPSDAEYDGLDVRMSEDETSYFAQTFSSVNSSDAIIRRVEEEIAIARKAAQDANRRLADVSTSWEFGGLKPKPFQQACTSDYASGGGSSDAANDSTRAQRDGISNSPNEGGASDESYHSAMDVIGEEFGMQDPAPSQEGEEVTESMAVTKLLPSSESQLEEAPSENRVTIEVVYDPVTSNASGEGQETDIGNDDVIRGVLSQGSHREQGPRVISEETVGSLPSLNTVPSAEEDKNIRSTSQDVEVIDVTGLKGLPDAPAEGHEVIGTEQSGELEVTIGSGSHVSDTGDEKWTDAVSDSGNDGNDDSANRSYASEEAQPEIKDALQEFAMTWGVSTSLGNQESDSEEAGKDPMHPIVVDTFSRSDESKDINAPDDEIDRQVAALYETSVDIDCNVTIESRHHLPETEERRNMEDKFMSNEAPESIEEFCVERQLTDREDFVERVKSRSISHDEVDESKSSFIDPAVERMDQLTTKSSRDQMNSSASEETTEKETQFLEARGSGVSMKFSNEHSQISRAGSGTSFHGPVKFPNDEEEHSQISRAGSGTSFHGPVKFSNDEEEHSQISRAESGTSFHGPVKFPNDEEEHSQISRAGSGTSFHGPVKFPNDEEEHSQISRAGSGTSFHGAVKFPNDEEENSQISRAGSGTSFHGAVKFSNYEEEHSQISRAGSGTSFHGAVKFSNDEEEHSQISRAGSGTSFHGSVSPSKSRDETVHVGVTRSQSGFQEEKETRVRSPVRTSPTKSIYMNESKSKDEQEQRLPGPPSLTDTCNLTYSSAEEKAEVLSTGAPDRSPNKRPLRIDTSLSSQDNAEGQFSLPTKPYSQSNVDNIENAAEKATINATSARIEKHQNMNPSRDASPTKDLPANTPPPPPPPKGPPPHKSGRSPSPASNQGRPPSPASSQGRPPTPTSASNELYSAKKAALVEQRRAARSRANTARAAIGGELGGAEHKGYVEAVKSKKVRFRQRYPVPPLIAKMRSPSEIIQDNELGEPEYTIHLAKPKKDLQQLLNAAMDKSLPRRANACGALKVLTLKPKNMLTLVRTAGFLEALVFAAEDDINPLEREFAVDARTRAICSIFNVSKPKDNRVLVYSHTRLPQCLVKCIIEDDNEARSAACETLAMLVKSPECREGLARVSRLVDVLAYMVAGKRDLSNFETLQKSFSSEDESKRFIERSPSSDEPSVTSSLGENSSKSDSKLEGEVQFLPHINSIRQQKLDNSEDLFKSARTSSCAALIHLSKHCAVSERLCANRIFLDSIITVTREYHNPLHTKCLEILCNLTRFPSNNAQLAKYPGVVDTLVKSGRAKSEIDRIWALRAFQNLSSDVAGKSVLATSVVLELLSVSVMRDHYDEKFAATATLYNLSTEPGAVVPLTNTKNVVATLVHVAHAQESTADIRLMACDALATLGLWLQTLAGAGTVPDEVQPVPLPSYVTQGWQRWD